MQPASNPAADHWPAIAAAFGVPACWLRNPQHRHTPHHSLGLWNCNDDRFYRHVYQQVRAAEGPNWLTNNRTPAQLLRWWCEYRPSRP